MQRSAEAINLASGAIGGQYTDPRTASTEPPAPSKRARSSAGVEKCASLHVSAPSRPRTRRRAAQMLHRPRSPITNRPPGRRTRTASRAAVAGSGRRQNSVTATTASNAKLGNGRLSTRPWIKHGRTRARSAVVTAAASIRESASRPTTRAPRAAIAEVSRPSPHPRASNRFPETAPTSSTTRRCSSSSVIAPSGVARHLAYASGPIAFTLAALSTRRGGAGSTLRQPRRFLASSVCVQPLSYSSTLALRPCRRQAERDAVRTVGRERQRLRVGMLRFLRCPERRDPRWRISMMH